jgi:hypothetical protein
MDIGPAMCSWVPHLLQKLGKVDRNPEVLIVA